MKTGLALGSVAARGLTHIGVLNAFEEKKISIDYISGSSIDTLIGAAYAMGMTLSEIENIALKTDWKLMAKIFLPTLSLSAIVNNKYVGEFLYSLFGDKDFEDLKIPFSVITTDIESGKMVVLESDNLLRAVRASISLPMLFSPVIYNSKKLVDGGLSNPIPVDIVKAQNVDRVIAVNLRGFSPINSSLPKENPIKNNDKKLNELTLNKKIEFFLKSPIKYFGYKPQKEEIEIPKFGS